MSADDRNVPWGLCQCGCGRPTTFRDGAYCTYVRGHNGHGLQRGGALDAHRAAWAEAGIPYGECLCGCGQETPIARSSTYSKSRLQGEPCRYVSGHKGSSLQWQGRGHREEDRGYHTKCWVWQGQINPGGYGLLWDREKARNAIAHRVYWKRLYGDPLPKVLDHLCGVRACVNPEHLEGVTTAENIRRGRSTKLDWGMVLEIRDSELPYKTLARKFGVCDSTICNIRSGRTWPEHHAPWYAGKD